VAVIMEKALGVVFAVSTWQTRLLSRVLPPDGK